MVCKIIWSPNALATYISVIEYLEKEFTQREVDNFILRVRDKLKILQLHPLIGHPTGKRRNIRRTLIHKKLALVYKFKPVKNEIEIISFWNNLQNPDKRNW